MKLFKNILCAVTEDETNKSTLERAVVLAEKNLAQLTVVDVIPRIEPAQRIPSGGPIPYDDMQAAMKADRMRTLESWVDPYRQRCPIRQEVLVGTGFVEIIRSVLRNEHDLVIKSAENPDFVERIFGSDDMNLLRMCPCPLWFTKPGEKSEYDCILAAVDLGPPAAENQSLNQQILGLSSSIAASEFTSLYVVHAWDALGERVMRLWSRNPVDAVESYVEGERVFHQQGLDDLQEQFKQRIGSKAYDYLSPHFQLKRGPATTVIQESAKQVDADLVVMGTVGRTGIPGLFMGNTAETILEQLQCSVLAIKPPDFISPVQLPRQPITEK